MSLTYGHWPPTPKCNGPLHIGTKTVYDPTVVSEQSVKELGYRIFKEGMEDIQYVSGSNQKNLKCKLEAKNLLASWI